MEATHTRRQYSVQTPIEMLRSVSKTIRKQLYHYAPEVKEKVPPKLHATASLEEEIAYTQEFIHFATDYIEQHANIKQATKKALTVLKDEAYQSILSVSE